MSIVEKELALLRHPRLAPLATSAWPAWLWSVDGSQMLWANAVGAAMFGGETVAAGTQRRFDVGDSPAPANRPLGRHAAGDRARAARAAARLWRSVRPRAHLRLLAHRPYRRQGRSADRGGGTGGTGAHPQRARASPVRRLRRADRRLRAGRNAGLCQRGGAGSALRRDHAVGARHRNARRDRARNRQRQRHRAHWPSGFRSRRHTPRQRRVPRVAAHHAAAAERSPCRAECVTRDRAS